MLPDSLGTLHEGLEEDWRSLTLKREDIEVKMGRCIWAARKHV